MSFRENSLCTRLLLAAVALAVPELASAQTTPCTLGPSGQLCVPVVLTPTIPALDLSVTVTTTTTLTADRTLGISVSVPGATGDAGANGGPVVSPTAGGRGDNGGPLTLTVNFATFDISTSAIFGLFGFQLFPPDQGITAHARGGQGGTGGDSVNFAAQGAGGGRGGNGGTIILNTTSAGGGIVTDGDFGGVGILAVSRGGTGGTGGTATGLTGFGGDGGLGGNGGSVTVNANNFIRTTGDGAVGVMAQSISGTGGMGGDGGGVVGGGGSGNDGGNAGTVNVTNSGAIRTFGSFAYGVFAQSLGGHGGEGGGAGGVVAFGGEASSGGDGRAVTLTNFGAVTTTGAWSQAVFAQSVGGNGGDAGGTGGVVALGGNGANGGDAGTVTVNNHGVITATGQNSRGIFAQSIGGGGGSGSGTGGVVAIGGRGGVAGTGGQVIVNNDALITSRGHSIFAQSIGGGGGSAGDSGGVVAIGGAGSGGGDAGTVSVTNEGTLRAIGSTGRGIFAQSVGGGGGDADVTAGLVAIGGSAGLGSSGGEVVVTNSGSIDSQRHSIFAQSVGGGGGDGGVSVGLYSLGSTGGGGGDADEVTVTNTGALSTVRSNAPALFAQSLGGGGGTGGGSVAIGVFYSGGLGGTGGVGGHSTVVDVTNYAPSISTVGKLSHGIQAQSVGGGGGTGGFSVSVSGGPGISVSIGVAGDGNTGGNSGAVTVRSSGSITTLGEEAYGIFAQSAGGGGGSGGWSVAAAGSDQFGGSLAVGGTGGGGGNASTVNVDTLDGWIQTSGKSAVGLFAQSIGGGGGLGGFSVAASGAGVGALSLAFGGSGGDGGDAESVVVDSRSRITTSGKEAHALQAQSVGGGGGSGFFAIAGSGAGTASGSLAIGGSGGGGGIGRSVEVVSRGELVTHGAEAIGLFAQSAGGGGGNGGFSIAASGAGAASGAVTIGGTGGGGGDGSDVRVRNEGAITTYGEKAAGLFAESTGGGGGRGGFSIGLSGAGTANGTVVLGGDGGGGGHGALVGVVNLGDIRTEGFQSRGLFAHSVGGGGGDGFFSIAGGGAGTASGSVSLGGLAGGGGDGDRVRVRNEASIVTLGAEAIGLFAQSAGGGGGNGGFSLAANGAGEASGSVSIGGSGGDGGNGANVLVANRGMIETWGESSAGLMAESIGGGGGHGRFSIAAGGAKTVSGAVSLGGTGGLGGHGASVRVDNDAQIITHGDNAMGLQAQSMGGGGGWGGFSIALTGAKAASASVSLGGSGNAGGNGAGVIVNNSGPVETHGTDSYALFAQSVGGGGGYGQFSIAGSGAKGGNASVSVGGFGGMGGAGGDVTIENSGALTVRGGSGSGIFAQSLGGGGGNGGFRFAGSLGIGGSKDAAVTVGGGGGIGGAGGIVSVLNSGAIDTGVDVSPAALKAQLAAMVDPTDEELEQLLARLVIATPAAGILAQSIGGGGGNGGASVALGLGTGSAKDAKDLNVAVAVGGAGGDGNFGGRVDVTNSGQIVTRKSDSDAIFAQSVGGGGGRGGVNRAALMLAGGQDGASLSSNTAVGGRGGSGNIGGLVFAQNSGHLVTHGDISAGVRAQSIGGGGGLGGAAGGANLNLEKPSLKKETGSSPDPWEFVFDVQIGGRGGIGNHGGPVTLVNFGAVDTNGNLSQGLFAQSVGGGGGSGGSGLGGFAMDSDPRQLSRETVLSWIEYFADDVLGAVNDVTDLVKDWKDFIKGQLWDQLEEWTVVVGGDAESSGNGGAVMVDNHGAITTVGLQSSGIYAQSVGGGGGQGIGFMSVASSGGSASGDLLSKAVVGGAGGSAGDGGAVTVINTGALVTGGDNAYGIFAQSVGGGGGTAGAIERSLDLFSIGAAIEQQSGLTRYPIELPKFHFGLITNLRGGASDGAGGEVIVKNTADITTTGPGAAGIFAQSVGGGGGISVDFAGSVGGGGAAGAVKITHIGTILTEGVAADGIFAQSAAGIHAGGAVTIEVTGNVAAKGEGSSAIFAQSRGNGGAGNITVTLQGGQVVGSLGDAAGVRLLEGATNTVTNFGWLGTMAGLEGTAVIATTGNDELVNHGTVVGSLNLGVGNNVVRNMGTGLFYAGPNLDLGGGSFLNSGFFSIGDAGAVAATVVNGNFTHARGSRWFVDLGEVGVSDRLQLLGGQISAQGDLVAGAPGTTVDLNLMTTPALTGAYTLMTAAGGGIGSTDFRLGTVFGVMPLGRTFAFVNTNTETQLTLLPSNGSFVWTGNISGQWVSSFAAGQSNWRRSDGNMFVYGTPGAASDVIFPSGATTALGADFGIRSLTFGGGGSIAGGQSLSLGSGGIAVQAGDVLLAPRLELASNQTWTNNGAGLLAIVGPGVAGAGRNLTVGGTGSISIESPVQIGTGSLTKIGGGTLFLSGLNTYTGGTSVFGGMLVSTTRSLGGAIRNDATVVFDQSDDGIYAGAMSGTGALYKTGAGDLQLTGANTYSGGTGLLAGTLRGNSTSLQGDILAEGSVIFDQTVDGTYAGNLFGAGSFTKIGAGALKMTGLGGSFTGQITIREGPLVIDGQFAGQLTMESGTTLGGTGVVPGVTVLNGATLAPGNSIGTLRVLGDVRFEPRSTYLVETHANGTGDLTIAGGRLVAGGGTVRVVAGAGGVYKPITRHGIFSTGGGIAGPFAGVSTDVSFLNPTLQYVGNEVHLTLRRNDVDFMATGARGSAGRVAARLNSLVVTADGAMAQVVNDVYGLDSVAAVKAMQSMSGLHYQYVMSGSLAEVRRFVQVTLGRLGQPVPGDAIGGTQVARGDTQPGWWFRALDSRTRLTGGDGDPDAHMPSAGFAIGLDKRFGQSLTLGVSGARTTPSIVQDNFGDHTSARMIQVGAYGRYRRGASRIDTVFVAADQDLRTRREVTITSPVGIDGDYEGRARSWRAEYGRAFSTPGISLEAVGGVHVDRLSIDAVNESGAGALNLIVPRQTVSIPRSVLGARAEKTFTRTSGLALRLEGRALWQHDFADRDDMALRFAGDEASGGFNLAAVQTGREGGVFGATFYGETRGSFRAFADVTFEMTGAVKSTMVSLGIGRRW